MITSTTSRASAGESCGRMSRTYRVFEPCPRTLRRMVAGSILRACAPFFAGALQSAISASVTPVILTSRPGGR